MQEDMVSKVVEVLDEGSVYYGPRRVMKYAYKKRPPRKRQPKRLKNQNNINSGTRVTERFDEQRLLSGARQPCRVDL